MNSITDEVVIKSSGRSVYRVSLVVVFKKECRFFAGYRKDREIGSGTAHNSASFVRCRERNLIFCLKERRKDLEAGRPSPDPVGCGCGSERRRNVVYMASASISKKQRAGSNIKSKQNRRQIGCSDWRENWRASRETSSRSASGVVFVAVHQGGLHKGRRRVWSRRHRRGVAVSGERRARGDRRLGEWKHAELIRAEVRRRSARQRGHVGRWVLWRRVCWCGVHPGWKRSIPYSYSRKRPGGRLEEPKSTRSGQE